MMNSEKDKIRHKIKNIKSLPTLPAVAQKITKMAEDEKTSAASLGDIISTDQALSGRVLRLVNSPFYGFPGRVSSISNAIVLLGFNVVKSLIVSVSVFELMEKGFIGLWEHSLGAAIAARIISQKTGKCEPEEVSVAALLHDIGKIIISIQMAESYTDIKNLVIKNEIIFYEAEKEVLGITHDEMGSWLAESWNLPNALIEPIQFHHEPARATQAKEATYIVHLADFLIRSVGYGSGGDPWLPPLNKKVTEVLELTSEDIKSIVTELSDELEFLEGDSLIS